MNSQEFVSLIKQKVRDAAVSGTFSNLTQPKGRRPNKSLLEMSEWFNSLSPEDK